MAQVFTSLRVLSSQLIRIRLLFLALGGVILFSGAAHASLTANFVDRTLNNNGTCTFNFEIVLSGAQRIDRAATFRQTCPSTGPLVFCNPPGTFVTIFDIPGILAANSTDTRFTTTIQPTGITPSTINPLFVDNPAIQNVTFTFNNDEIILPDRTFTGFSIVSTFCGINNSGNFASQDTKNDPGHPSDGTTLQQTGTVAVPAFGISTAATVAVSGKVLSPKGRAVANARVTLTTSSGETLTTVTDEFGNYQFSDVVAGGTVTIDIKSRLYTFETQILSLSEETNGLNFTARSSKERFR